MMDSSVKNLEEFEYDKHNWLYRQKTQVRPKRRSEGYLLLPLYINQSVTKIFPIETLLEMIDSSVKNLGEVEYDKQNWIQHFRAYVDNMRYVPDNYLSALEAPHRLGLRSSASRPDENQIKFAQPIDSRRVQCERTALSHMIHIRNSLSNSFSQLSYNVFKNKIKNGEILSYLMEAKVLTPLDVPVRHST